MEYDENETWFAYESADPRNGDPYDDYDEEEEENDDDE